MRACDERQGSLTCGHRMQLLSEDIYMRTTCKHDIESRLDNLCEMLSLLRTLNEGL